MKHGQRADTFKRGFYSDADIDDEEKDTDVYSFEIAGGKGIKVNLPKKRWIVIARPYCYECKTRDVYIDENRDAVCQNCGALKGKSTATLDYDKGYRY